MVKIKNRTVVVLHDLFMAALAWQLAWFARFNFEFPFPDWKVSLFSLPYLMIVQGIIYWRINLYRGLWRFASLPDLWNIFRAALLGGVIITLVLFTIFRLEGVPRSVLILYPVFLTFLLGAPRLGYRLWKDHTFKPLLAKNGNKVLIVGAGRAGEMIARDMLRDGNYMPIGFVDDNRELKNSEIHGLRVLGRVEGLNDLVEKYEPSLIIIAIPSATSEQMQKVASYCEMTGLPIRTLPKLSDMVSTSPTVNDIRELSIEDLLGRDKVELDFLSIQGWLMNKVIFVSGGGGSIGSELCRQITNLNPQRLIIFERSEFNLYNINQELSLSHPDLNITGILGDICDEEQVNNAIKTYHPDVIFHAAAYKHVPILQEHCREAIKNNVLGTYYLVNASERYGCSRFVMISTDKAVNPVNVLGATKRIAEMICETRNIGNTRFITVRFGNVLGSDGSVVPLFKEQILNGGPVTVTHPEMQRYFMTIKEACQLILQSSVMGEGGEIFVLDMGKPVKISYLAEQMIKLSGSIPGRDIEIQFTGLRPGEKLNEELFHADEHQKATSHAKILLATHPEINRDKLQDNLQSLLQGLNEFDEDKLKAMLFQVLESMNSHNTPQINNVISMNPGNT